MFRALLACITLLFPLSTFAVLVTTDLDGGTTPAQMVQTFIGTNQVTVSNVQFTGNNSAAGLFSNGLAAGFNMDTGIILSTGRIADAAGPNNQGAQTFTYNSAGDTDLDMFASAATRDAVSLQFDFVAVGDMVVFEYVFASEEYNEFANSTFNDVFAFLLNGQNVATIGGAAVSVNTVNNSTNSGEFNDNDFANFGGVSPFNTEFDGFTMVLQVQVAVTPGSTNTLKLAIADVNDASFDSAVLLREGTLTTVPPAIEVATGGVMIPDGSTTPIDFGTTTVNTPVTMTFTITNTGGAELTLSPPTLPAGFSLLGAFPTSIPGTTTNPRLRVGGMANFQVQLNAAAVGNFNGQIAFANNDPNQNPFNFAIAGVVNAAAAVPAPTGPPVVPTMSEWMLIILSVLILLVGLNGVRRVI
ncbi:MAG: IPTL-CTERM sorting domain-containing protein [Pseudomonadota bacterium]